MAKRLRRAEPSVDTATRTPLRVAAPRRSLSDVRLRSGIAAAALLLMVCAAPPAAGQGRGTLDYTRVLDTSGGVYIEGSISYLRVRDGNGALVLARQEGPIVRFRVRRSLPAGRYRLTSFERPCDGNCSALDLPVARCSRRIKILAGGRTGVRTTVRPARGCRMSVKARPALFPPPARIAAARRFLRGRTGIESWALLDSHGRVHGYTPNRVYVSASVVKAMLLVAYLRKIGNRMPSPAERASLGPMITVSDNGRASAIYGRVGGAALQALARRARMRTFSDVGYWSGALFSATDQARFFAVFDRLTPPRSRRYARSLLSSIVAYQRWGFSRFSLANGFKTFFKGGWRGRTREPGPRGRSVRARPAEDLDGGAHRRQPLPRLRHRNAARRGAADLQAPPGPARPARRRAALSTCTATDRASRSTWSTGRRTTSPAAVCPATARTGRSCASPPPATWRVQRHLRRRGLGLLVLDAYRPARATQALVRWARAKRSGRARGHLHRSAKPPQHRHRGGPDAGAQLRRPPARDGQRLRRPEPPRAHRQRRRAALRNRLSSSGRWSASGTAPTGASGGTSSTASRRAPTSTCRSAAPVPNRPRPP